MLRTIIVLAAIGFIADLCSASSGSWGPMDVSYLFPLPTSISAPESIRPSTSGAQGALIPSAFLALMPQLTTSLSKNEALDRLRVVGVRIDPCFGGEDPVLPGRCRAQVRVVWQPLEQITLSDGCVQVRAIDAALHSFYSLSQEQFAQFAEALASLNRRTGMNVSALPLSVNPTLAREGLDGNYGRELKKILLEVAGEKTLWRLTFMTVGQGGLQWVFGGYEIFMGKATPIAVARVGSATQVFVNSALPATDFFGGVGPAPSGQDALNRLISDSRKAGVSEPVRLRAAHSAVVSIENPKVLATDNVDCVSCHVASPARIWIESKLPELRSGVEHLHAPGGTNVMRAFGYFEDRPVISKRALQESAAVAELMNAKYAVSSHD